MAQNTSYDTVARLIRDAYVDASIVERTVEPDSEQYADGLNRINDMIGLWQTQGLKLWTNTDQSITLVAGTATYTLGTGGTGSSTRPMRVIMGYYLDTNANRRPLIPMSRSDYTLLSQPTQSGTINSYFFDPQQTLAQVTFWLTPDTQAATGTAHLIWQRPITYVTGLLDLINFPQEWYLALRWGLADELASGQPMSVQQRCAQKANAYRAALENFDVEDGLSTNFSPDQRAGTYNRGFM